jgi:signal transduction histidine kinase
MASADTSAGQSASQEPAKQARDRTPLRRHPERGLLGGVCAGLAEHYGLDEILVRVVMGAFIAFGGIGVAIYALAWALIPVAPDAEQLPPREHLTRDWAVALLGVVALSVALRVSGLHFGEPVVWPMVLGVVGLALVWRSTAVAGEQRSAAWRWPLPGRLREGRRIDGPRLVVGALLAAFASASLLHTVGVLHSLGKAIGAVAFVALVLSLLVGPWVVRLGRTLSSERAARIREQERAEVAAHLHDSVLQTLALIQKRAGDPREVAGLARRQERELRHWLLARPGPSELETVAAALERVAAEVEELHGVAIEVVTVGDAPLTAPLEAVVQAAREALTNAAKFAGSERVDLYAEVDADRVHVFVRDRGIGFDPHAVPADRRGVRDSIIARIERHRGRAAVHSAPGEGTEVELVMGRGAAP